MGGEIKIMNVEDSFRKLGEEGKEKVAIVYYLREKKIGVQILRLDRLMQVCRLCIRNQKRGRNTVDCRGDWRNCN